MSIKKVFQDRSFAKFLFGTVILVMISGLGVLIAKRPVADINKTNDIPLVQDSRQSADEGLSINEQQKPAAKQGENKTTQQTTPEETGALPQTGSGLNLSLLILLASGVYLITYFLQKV